MGDRSLNQEVPIQLIAYEIWPPTEKRAFFIFFKHYFILIVLKESHSIENINSDKWEDSNFRISAKGVISRKVLLMVFFFNDLKKKEYIFILFIYF